MAKDTKAQAEGLKKAGAELWAAVEKGIFQQMHDSEYKKAFAWLLAPAVAGILENQNDFSGGP